jgi:hypothetical protein
MAAQTEENTNPAWMRGAVHVYNPRVLPTGGNRPPFRQESSRRWPDRDVCELRIVTILRPQLDVTQAGRAARLFLK